MPLGTLNCWNSSNHKKSKLKGAIKTLTPAKKQALSENNFAIATAVKMTHYIVMKEAKVRVSIYQLLSNIYHYSITLVFNDPHDTFISFHIPNPRYRINTIPWQNQKQRKIK